MKTSRILSALAAPLAAAAVLASSASCVHYRLGSMLPSDIKTVAVPTAKNNTDEPFLEQDATSAIIGQIQMDGSLKVVSEDQADAVLSVVLTRFWLDPVSYVSGSASTANEYRMNLSASIVLRRRSDNAVVVESPSVVGWTDFDFTGDLTSSKSIALRPTADDLGRRIVDTLVQYWPENVD